MGKPETWKARVPFLIWLPGIGLSTGLTCELPLLRSPALPEPKHQVGYAGPRHNAGSTGRAASRDLDARNRAPCRSRRPGPPSASRPAGGCGRDTYQAPASCQSHRCRCQQAVGREIGMSWRHLLVVGKPIPSRRSGGCSGEELSTTSPRGADCAAVCSYGGLWIRSGRVGTRRIWPSLPPPPRKLPDRPSA
jgi:hypothetical protein